LCEEGRKEVREGGRKEGRKGGKEKRRLISGSKPADSNPVTLRELKEL
jgi:hypothetical protein